MALSKSEKIRAIQAGFAGLIVEQYGDDFDEWEHYKQQGRLLVKAVRKAGCDEA